MAAPDATFLAAIDQGTSSSRVIIYDEHLVPLVAHAKEFNGVNPKPGWAEIDPLVLIDTVNECIAGAFDKLREKVGVDVKIRCVGVTNQRETTCVWSRKTGFPLAPAIFWYCQRTKHLCDVVVAQRGGDRDCLRSICGLPVNSYFSGLKMRWLIENVLAVRKAVDDGDAMFGTVDTWLVYKLTQGKCYVTDVTNASRTMLLNLKSLQW